MIVPINFKPEYEQEYKYLLSKSNRSNFVCRLIRKHIEKERFDQFVSEKEHFDQIVSEKNDTASTVSLSKLVDHKPSK